MRVTLHQHEDETLRVRVRKAAMDFRAKLFRTHLGQKSRQKNFTEYLIKYVDFVSYLHGNIESGSLHLFVEKQICVYLFMMKMKNLQRLT